MAFSNITLGGPSGTQTVELLDLPASPAPRTIEPWISDNVAISKSIWTGYTQTQTFPGGDQWGLTVTLPPLLRGSSARAWTAWLMAMRGMRRAVRLAMPDWQPIASSLQGSIPAVDGSDTSKNRAGSIVLRIKGLEPNARQLFQPGDQIQIGYRSHWIVLPVDADANGKAAVEVFPSLREQPADGTLLVYSNDPAVPDGKPRGPLTLFRLADNKRNWSNDVTKLTRMSFQLLEYR